MNFVQDIWYFAGLHTDIKPGRLTRRELAGLPVVLGQQQDGRLFACLDICPHRAAPLSAGRLVGDSLECPYHGWRFGTDNGRCRVIPSLCTDQNMNIQNIRVRTFPVRKRGYLLWIYIASDTRFDGQPDIEPPDFVMVDQRPVFDENCQLNCHIDHAVIGLMDPAHGPFVHQQWWWRTQRSIHEKAKHFEPCELGFRMVAHPPSRNSFAYRLLGRHPQTEISFQLPGIRVEKVKVGTKTLLSFTAITPLSAEKSHIRQMFFTDIGTVKWLMPLLKYAARAFLHQDKRLVDLQQSGLAHHPNLLLIDDADKQAKWYQALKKTWKQARQENKPFINPVKAQTLRWRS